MKATLNHATPIPPPVQSVVIEFNPSEAELLRFIAIYGSTISYAIQNELKGPVGLKYTRRDVQQFFWALGDALQKVGF